MSEVRVLVSGLLTTVQDLGRWGFQSRGVPVAGPMDPFAHRLANALVGNHRTAATLEITLAGPELQLDDEQRLVAVAGAPFEWSIDGRAMPMAAVCTAPPAARLKFGRRYSGARSYLAFEGGITVPSVFGSRATHVTTRMGGLHGRSLKAGDRLPLGPRHAKTSHHAEHAAVQTAASPHPARIRVLPGLHAALFANEALHLLQASPYVVDHRSDRMGFRLNGSTIAQGPAEMISDVTPMGTLQVPPSGLPILLMADRQTTGGYPQLATMITADFGVAAQLAPGDSVSFVVCSHGEAVAALLAQERALMLLERPHAP